MAQSIYLLIILIPFQIYFYFYKNLPVSAAQLLAGFLFFAAVWKSRRFGRWLSSSLDWSIVIFICVMFASIFVSNNKAHSIQSFVKWTSFILLYFVAYINADSVESLKKYLKIVFLAALPIAIIGIVEFFLGHDFVLNWVLHNKPAFIIMEPNYLKEVIANGNILSSNWFSFAGTGIRAFGTFEDSISFSAYLGLIIPFFVYFGKFSLKYSLTGIIVIIAALILTFTRSAYLPLIIISLFFSYHLLKYLSWRKLAGVMIVIIFLAGLVTYCKPVRDTISARCYRPLEEQFDRKPLWQNGIKIFLARPVLGVGLANYRNGLVAFGNRDDQFLPAHNNYIQIAAETGILGLTAYMAVLFFAIKYSYTVYKKSKNSEMQIIALCFLGMWIWFCVQSLFNSDLFGDKFSMMFWLMVGFNAALHRIYLAEQSPGSGQKIDAWLDSMTGAQPTPDKRIL